MFEIAWKEVLKSGRLTIKRKAFDSERKMNAFIERLYDKDGFIEIIAYK